MRVNAKGFKQEQTDETTPASVTFTGTEIGVESAGIEFKFSDHIIEKKIASSQEPEKRIKVGAHMEFMATACSSDLNLLALMLNETVSTKTITTKATITPEVLPLHAVTFQTDLPDDPDSDTLETWTATALNFFGDIDAAYQAEEAWYLPVKAQSTADSELSIVQS